MLPVLAAYEAVDRSGPLHAYAGSSPVTVCGQAFTTLLARSWPIYVRDLAGQDVCPHCWRVVYGNAAV